MKKPLLLLIAFVLTLVVLSSCAHRDCQGNKHRVKTDMGGYL